MSEIMDLILKNEREAKDVIRLIASENLPGVEERLPFMLDMYARYSFDDDTVWRYPTYYLSDIERITENYLKEYLDCKYVSVKPISGLNGMLSAVSAFCSPGDTVMSLSPNDGGHFETSAIITKLGLNNIFLPFDRENWEIDIEKFKEYTSNNKVKVVYLDLCMVAFSVKLEKLKEAMDKDTLLIYDASHVLGLIVGDQFQKPLKEGADIIISSTHKTFPGTQKAIFATNRRVLKWGFDNNCNHFISHHHMAEVAALGLILGKGKEYFQHYAADIIHNSKRLSQGLYDSGINVQFASRGFSDSHQIWIGSGDKADVDSIINCLSELKIVVNGAIIPSLNGSWGIRIGLQEVTNRGITEDGIDLLSRILAKVINERVITNDIISMKKELVDNCFTKKISSDKVEKIIGILAEV